MVSFQSSKSKAPFFLFFVSSTATAAIALHLLLGLPFGCHAKEPRNNHNNNNNNNNNNTADTGHDESIYHALGVDPPHNNVLRLPVVGLELPLSRWSWRIHGKILPLLHLFDGRTPDVFVNQRVLWCKLLSSLNPASRAYEGEPQQQQQQQQRRCWWRSSGGHQSKDDSDGIQKDPRRNEKEEQQQLGCCCYYATYRMLPPCSIRWPLRYLRLWRLFPRWMHANIELRTVYLKGALARVLLPRRPPPGDREDAFSVSSGNHGVGVGVGVGVGTAGDDPEQTGLFFRGDGAGDANHGNPETNLCVIVLGGGYDPRGAILAAGAGASSYDPSSDSEGDTRRHTQRTTSTGTVVRVYELDLPVVVDSKRRLLRRAGFRVVESGRDDDGDSANTNGVRLEGVDMNEDAAVDRVLDKIGNELHRLSCETNGNASETAAAVGAAPNKEKKFRWRVVVISEAVLMYLKPSKAGRILEGLAKRFGGRGGSSGASDQGEKLSFADATFVFADRLFKRNATAAPTLATPPVSSDASGKQNGAAASSFESPEEENESELVRSWLRDRGWDLQELLLKPGATRHLGIATTA